MEKIHHNANNTDICYMSDIPNGSSLYVIEVGHNTPPHGYSPKICYRNCYVLHYVVSGRLIYRGQTIDAPCMFWLSPQYLHHYQVDASEDAPAFEQYWIMFSGSDTSKHLANLGFDEKPRAYPCPEIAHAIDIFVKLQDETNYINQNDFYYSLSMLFNLFSLHATSKNMQVHTSNSKLVQLICNYIRDNYASIEKEEEIAKQVHLSKNHMHKIFKKEMGIPPMHFLNEHRINCSKKLLLEHDLAIYEIAEMLGFSTPNYFCYVFQKHCGGISPSEYRKKRKK